MAMETPASRESLGGLCIQQKDSSKPRRRPYAKKGGSTPPLPPSNHLKGVKFTEKTRLLLPSSWPRMEFWLIKGPAFATWTLAGMIGALRHHPLPCLCALSMLFFMGVEYTIRMVPHGSPPLDLGFLLTESFHSLLAARPILNSVLAALNTMFVGAQAAYILSTLLIEGRSRPTIAALFMFTCRGILGCSTQLPVPQEFLGSGVDFPVGNVSFFLFFSGHVAGSMIASLDMRRMRHYSMASAFDILNLLQGLRLLSSRGHYTIDLAAGVGAGYIFDNLAGKYLDSKLPMLGQDQHQRM